jgi:hypothetical protein
MKRICTLVFYHLLCLPLLAQNLTQTIRGRVVDAELKFPLPGASVMVVAGGITVTGSTSDAQGEYRLDNIPVGRHTIRITFLGYKEAVLNNIILTSAKEVILNVELQASTLSLEGVEITATRSGQVQNEMATVSARAFTIDETDRYAGSRGDPARMASNFAGVQGADDSRNDIVIRGNSPQGVLWQVEGINIPNPNHFAIPGTAGGPVSILNNKVLANSDFYTGAFPAEFGNSIAGAFDLRLRNGNNQKHEFSGQFGFLGTELFAEGPLSKTSGASYLVSYRYSTLSLFSGLGINIGTTAVPKYQDGAFRLNFPLKSGGSVALFGVGGMSDIDIMISEQDPSKTNIYGENDRDQYFGSKMGFTGITYTQPIGQKAMIKATVAASTEIQDAYHEYIDRQSGSQTIEGMLPMLRYTFGQQKYSGILSYTNRVNPRNTFQAGANSDLYAFNFQDSVRNINKGDANYLQWRTRWQSREPALLLQPYMQWKHRFTDFISITAGLHSQYFSLNNSLSVVEPRLGFSWAMANRQTLSAGIGVHSQLQPTYLYFYARQSPGGQLLAPHNKDMGFTRSNHYVLSYEKILGQNIRLKAETYYQHLYDIPVEVRSSSFSLVNTGAGFSRFMPNELTNAGIGQNYGVELTLERFFSRGYFFLLTGSLFESKFQGSDGVWRDTDFNGNYAFNALFTREVKVRRNHTFSAGTKVTAAGGRRYGPVDLEASEREKEVIFIEATRNSLQFRDYFRTDLRVNYRINRARVTHELAIDFINMFNTKNILKLTFAPPVISNENISPVREEYQLGFLPIFYYKIDF